MTSHPIRLTRKELYAKVWSQPVHTLAKEYGISDVGLKKICRRRDIPTLGLGYWATGLHLQPVFGGQPLSAITMVAVRAYSVARQTEGASNATVNRELIPLKRMLSLAVQADKIPRRPYIPLLKEQNARRGFFEPAQIERVLAHLPEHVRGVASFAYITGWRTPSEILTLEWRQVDMEAGEVWLDPGTTKNGDGRVFPMTRELRQVLQRQQTSAETLRRDATCSATPRATGPVGGSRIMSTSTAGV